jgi:4-hydroxy-2-oxoheptanedioate aldolase
MNAVKDILKAGKTAIGTTAGLASPVDFLADSGFDFILFDTQHAAVEIKQLQGQLQAMRGKKAVPVVRVGSNDQAQVCYALDIGAKGIIVPMVNNRQEMVNMTKYCWYPPAGIRSSAGMRGEWGTFKNYREYMEAVNEELLVIPMVETVDGMSNLEDILSVPGIDVLLVGPSDLSIALDLVLDYDNPKYQKELDRIVAACEDAGVYPGMYFLPAGHDPNMYVEKGFRFFTVPWAPWAAAGVKNGLATVKR